MKVKILERKVLKQGMLPEWEDDPALENKLNEFLKGKKVFAVNPIDANHFLVVYD